MVVSVKDRILSGLTAFFCIVGILQTIITISELFALDLHLEKYTETKFIVAGVYGAFIAVAQNPKQVIFGRDDR